MRYMVVLKSHHGFQVYFDADCTYWPYNRPHEVKGFDSYTQAENHAAHLRNISHTADHIFIEQV